MGHILYVQCTVCKCTTETTKLNTKKILFENATNSTKEIVHEQNVCRLKKNGKKISGKFPRSHSLSKSTSRRLQIQQSKHT